MKAATNLLIALMMSLLGSLNAAAQDTQDKTAIKILGARKIIELDRNSTKPLPRTFVQSAEQASTYRLYEVESPDPEKMCKFNSCINELVDFLDTTTPPKCALGTDCQRITLRLKNELLSDRNYLLVVSDFVEAGKPGKLPFKGVTEAEIVGPFNIDNLGKNFRVKANGTIQAAASVTVNRLAVRLSADSMNVVEVPVSLNATKDPTSQTPTAAEFKFDKKLPEGREYDLTIPSGITDSAGQAILAKGKLKIPGTPAKPDDPKISLSLTSVSAVKQKSVFDLSGKFSPRNNPNTGLWYWEPSLSFDVGLRSTKSNNSIVFALPITHFFAGKEPEIVDQSRSNIPIYAGWITTPRTRLGSVKFYIGPKAEFDRKFQRKNVLGNVRLDFNFYRWLGSIKYKRDLIAKREPPFGIGKEKGQALEGIDFGFKLVPYLSFDFGGHVNNETVTKTVAKVPLSVLVPRHGIFRSYAGFLATIEWKTFWLPTTLTLDESIVYMATTEKIGFTTDTGVFLRELRGVHPHFKTTLDFAFDPAKHYSFTVTYEDGRLAPNFEYLNKVTAGIKVQY
jgi:hypothetical protein